MSDLTNMLELMRRFAVTMTSSFEINDVLYQLGDSAVAIFDADAAGVSLATADDRLEFITATDQSLIDLEMVQQERGAPFPMDPHEQLWGAIGAVFGSWMNPRANTYRRLHDIPVSWGTAVSVQASSHSVGSAVTHAYWPRFILNSTQVPSISAIPASIWLAMPNSGHKVLMPPSGSTTPWYRK